MDSEVFVARQPILDRRGAVVAQELLFRDCRSGVAGIHDGFACTTMVVKRVLGVVGIESVLGDVEGFLNCTDEFLFSDLINLLPASRFVLEVLEDTELTPELGERCDALRQAGFRIALDDVREIAPALSEFLTHVDIVKLDWPYIAAGEVGAMVDQLKRAGKLVLAEKVEQRTEHEAAMRAGCDLFQGFYFAKPQLLAVK
ncbi:EAL and HDOD domain-containing protein [Caballeronia sordidicola]|uniref:EAL and HDOD domain-containing protein n=1 Tax=Caballeronia sordidicola TaxID=196367 RepID=UPI00094D458E|nr:EAL domain-containing protein [Caballeronia sordidicola]